MYDLSQSFRSTPQTLIRVKCFIQIRVLRIETLFIIRHFRPNIRQGRLSTFLTQNQPALTQSRLSCQRHLIGRMHNLRAQIHSTHSHPYTLLRIRIKIQIETDTGRVNSGNAFFFIHYLPPITVIHGISLLLVYHLWRIKITLSQIIRLILRIHFKSNPIRGGIIIMPFILVTTIQHQYSGHKTDITNFIHNFFQLNINLSPEPLLCPPI